MGINTLTFNNVNSKTYGVYISGTGVFNAPARDREMIQVPGRNGDIIIDHGRYQNIEITYPAFIVRDFASNIRTWCNKLLEPIDYVRLEDTYHPSEFRLTVLAQGMEVDPVAWLAAGSFDLRFNCRPERFLKSGETATTFTAKGSISNPTDMPSKPLIRVYGSGSLTVNGTEVEIAQHNYTYIDIDCDLQEAFFESQNANEYISLDEFPKLDSGANSIVLDGVTRVEITPRWWRL
ncbi:MAG TPA: hypothetical protein P5092_17775 [Ruminococcus sp.]|nr:hypothetical protein [Ruminococcus sp.]